MDARILLITNALYTIYFHGPTPVLPRAFTTVSTGLHPCSLLLHPTATQLHSLSTALHSPQRGKTQAPGEPGIAHLGVDNMTKAPTGRPICTIWSENDDECI